LVVGVGEVWGRTVVRERGGENVGGFLLKKGRKGNLKKTHSYAPCEKRFF